MQSAWAQLEAPLCYVQGAPNLSVHPTANPGGAGGAGREVASGDRASKRRRRSSSSTSPKSEATPQDPPAVSRQPLWRVNVALIRQELRHKACVDLVAAKRGESAGTLVATVLSYQRRHSDGERDDENASAAAASQPPPLHLDALYSMLPDEIEW
jgi:hypothetical protein